MTNGELSISEVARRDLGQLLRLLHRADTVALLPGHLNCSINPERRQGAYIRVQSGTTTQVFFLGLDPSQGSALVLEFLGDNTATSGLAIPSVGST